MKRFFSPKNKLYRHRGMAVITALLVVALATMLVTGLIWRTFVSARTVENMQVRMQSKWLVRTAIDWARLILKQDNSQTTNLDQPWAMPIKDMPLSDLLLSAGQKTGKVAVDEWINTITLSGSLEDEQAKLNLVNLLSPPQVAGKPAMLNKQMLNSYSSLLSQLSLDQGIAQKTANYMLANQAQLQLQGPGGQAQGNTSTSSSQNFVIESLADLSSALGYDKKVLQTLAPYVTFIPGSTPGSVKLNINTATAITLSAVLGISLPVAQQLVVQRDKNYFNSTADLLTRLTAMDVNAANNLQKLTPDNFLVVRSDFFVVHTRIRSKRSDMAFESLIWRPPLNATVLPTQILLVREVD